MFVLTILEKLKETPLKFPKGGVTVLWRTVNYKKARVKLKNNHLSSIMDIMNFWY